MKGGELAWMFNEGSLSYQPSANDAKIKGCINGNQYLHYIRFDVQSATNAYSRFAKKKSSPTAMCQGML